MTKKIWLPSTMKNGDQMFLVVDCLDDPLAIEKIWSPYNTVLITMYGCYMGTPSNGH